MIKLLFKSIIVSCLLSSSSFAKKAAFLEIYSGWSSPRGGFIYGRAQKGKPPPLPQPGQSDWRHLIDNVNALKTNGLEHVKVSAQGVAKIEDATTSETGFFTLTLPKDLSPGETTVIVSAARKSRKAPPVHFSLPVWDDLPGLAVISDIDDTVTDTGVTHKWTMLKNTLLNSKFEMKTFAGTAELLQTLAGNTSGKAVRPLFFISGSPWPLHQRIQDFFDSQNFPKGAVILRRYSTESMDPFSFKHPHLLQVIDAFPHKQFILLGDSGEKDPEVYAAVNKERPGRIKATYIHNVNGARPTDPRFAGMVLVKEWDEAIKDAQTSGLAIK